MLLEGFKSFIQAPFKTFHASGTGQIHDQVINFYLKYVNFLKKVYLYCTIGRKEG